VSPGLLSGILAKKGGRDESGTSALMIFSPVFKAECDLTCLIYRIMERRQLNHIGLGRLERVGCAICP
jgi:hypothetical protein